MMKLIGRLIGACGLIFTGMVWQECYHQKLEREAAIEE